MNSTNSPSVPCPRMHAVVVGDVVAVVLVGRGIERQQPQAGDAEAGEIVAAVGQPGEIADAVAVAVHVRLDVEAVDDGVLVPKVMNHARAGAMRVPAKSGFGGSGLGMGIRSLARRSSGGSGAKGAAPRLGALVQVGC